MNQICLWCAGYGCPQCEKKKRCVACGIGRVIRAQAQPVPTCNNCREQYIDAAAAAYLDSQAVPAEVIVDEPTHPMLAAQVESAPVTNKYPAVWALVMKDMQDRDNFGLAKYGTRLQPHNGRDSLVDAYQEALDLAAYIRQQIFERDGK